MSGFLHSRWPVFLFTAGALHFLHVGVTGIFFLPLKGGSAECPSGSKLIDSLRQGLALFVLGSGILVMAGARDIPRGGQLAVSVCVLLGLVFSYRLYVQLFQFTSYLRLGASRPAHWGIVLVTGFLSIVYLCSAIALFIHE